MQPSTRLATEQALLGSLLLDPTQLDAVSCVIVAGDFQCEKHRIIFRHLAEMRKNENEIDLLLFRVHLENAGTLAEIGGDAYLGELVTGDFQVSHAAAYAAELCEKRSGRGTSVFDRLPVVLSNVEMIEAFVSEKQRAAKRRTDRISTGLADWDDMTGGLFPGELTCIAGSPQIGTTALAINVLHHFAAFLKESSLMISLDIDCREFMTRLFALAGRIEAAKLRNNYFSTVDQSRFEDAYKMLGDSPFFFAQTSTLTITEIAYTARVEKRRQDTRLLVVDTLSRLDGKETLARAKDRIRIAFKRLKKIAVELEIPVLCTLRSPAPGHLESLIPDVQSLAADTVCFLDRPDVENFGDEFIQDNKRQLTILKQPCGPTGVSASLQWFPEWMAFANRIDNPLYDWGDEIDEFQEPSF